MEDRILSDVVWTPERGLSQPEVRGIAWDNFLLSDEYGGKWRTDAGVRVTPETALQSTVVLAACRILAESIAALPIHVYRRTEKGGREKATDVPLYKVLSFAPNGWQTKFEFFEQIVMNLCLWGNSYSQIKSGRYGAVSELINLHPSRMDVERLENGRLRYVYTNPETGRLEPYTQDQIMHVRWTPEPDGIKGMVPVEIAREAIALARACESHAAKYWANSARPGVVLQTDGSLSPEAAERLRDNWERLHRGSQNAWRTAVLTNGLKAEPLGFSAEQSQAIESRRFSVEELSRVYRLPLHLIQGTTGGDLETQGQEFVTYTLSPWLRRIESAISRSLIYNDDVFFAEFDVRGLLRSDSNRRASYYSTMTNLGIMSINECRALENLPPLEHGDNHFVAMNMQTLEEASKPKQDPMAAMMAGAGAPPPATGGVPSLPGVKTGAAPQPSEQGDASEKKQPIAEGDVVTWGDGRVGEVQHVMDRGTLDLKSGEKIKVSPGSPVALVVEAETGEEVGVKVSELAVAEKRAFCPTGDGGGVDNSCSSGETSSEKAARIRDTERSLPESIEAGDARLSEYQQFSPSSASEKNSDHISVPSDAQILQSLASDKSPKFGKNRTLPEGQRVALRIDIPAYENHGVYAVTVHSESNSKSGVGAAVGYDSIVRLVGEVSFKADEKTATQIAIGRNKTPLATVVGSLTQNRDVPDNINDWTPVGYNPKKAAYFFDKKTGREVVGGTDSISVGNTVFVRVPKYGDRNAAKAYRSFSFWGLESRELSQQNESLHEAQETIAETSGKWPQEGPSGAHYMEQNPFASRGIACKNCVYFQSGNQCEIVDGAIQPTAICKLWVIPEEKLSLAPEERAFCPTGPGGGVDNSCGGGESSSSTSGKIAKMAIASIAATKGFSIHPVSVTSPSTGYMVSVEPDSETVLDSEESITADAISKFMANNKSKFESRPTLHVGGWIDSRDGKVYLDLSERFEDIDDAIDSAESTNQLAIWDLNEKKEIRKEDYSARRKRGGGETRSVRLSDRSDGGADRRGPPQGEAGTDGEERGGEAAAGRQEVDDGWESATECSRSIVAEASGLISSLPNVVFRSVGNSIATYDRSTDSIYVSPSLEPHHMEALSLSSDSGWLSQPNPILHEYSHRYHMMSDPDGYEQSCGRELTPSQRSLIAEEVSRYAATGASEFVAEYIAGRLSGKTYSEGVKEAVLEVTSGAVRL